MWRMNDERGGMVEEISRGDMWLWGTDSGWKSLAGGAAIAHGCGRKGEQLDRLCSSQACLLVHVDIIFLPYTFERS